MRRARPAPRVSGGAIRRAQGGGPLASCGVSIVMALDKPHHVHGLPVLQNWPEISNYVDGERPPSVTQTLRDVESEQVEHRHQSNAKRRVPPCASLAPCRGRDTRHVGRVGIGRERRAPPRIPVPAERCRGKRNRKPCLDPLTRPDPPYELMELVAWRRGGPAQVDELLTGNVRARDAAYRRAGNEPGLTKRPFELDPEPAASEGGLPGASVGLIDRYPRTANLARHPHLRPADGQRGRPLVRDSSPRPANLPGRNRRLVSAPGGPGVHPKAVLPLVPARKPPAPAQAPPQVDPERHAPGVVRVRVIAPHLLRRHCVAQQRGLGLVTGIPKRPKDAELNPAGVGALPPHRELALRLVVRKAESAGQAREHATPEPAPNAQADG